METLRDKFNDIRKLNDLQPYLMDTEDGETPTLEFKSLQKDSFSNNNIGNTKAKLAKEICAFLNTNDGMILWGGGIDKATNKVVIANDSGEKLADFLDNKLLTLIEPAPKGIDYHKIEDDDGNEALLVFVPRSDFAPHRVGSWDAEEGKKGKDKIIGRYFQRVGTNSQVMPENLVRSMYLSNGRLPNVEAGTMLAPLTSSDRLELLAVVQPDKFDFIESYHLTQEIALIGDYLNALQQDSPWEDIDNYIAPTNQPYIYPSSEAYPLWSNAILSDEQGSEKTKGVLVDLIESVNKIDNDIHLTEQAFNQIFAIATRTSFASRGIQVKYHLRLYIIGPRHSWPLLIESGKSQKQFRKVDKLSGLEREYNIEILVSLLYKDNEIIDDRSTALGSDGNSIKMSHIENLLKHLICDE